MLLGYSYSYTNSAYHRHNKKLISIGTSRLSSFFNYWFDELDISGSTKHVIF